VLLAEDNPVNREVAEEMLNHVGLRVDLAENGLQAVELATTRAYDLVLMDVQMPQLDGLEATRRIRARLGTALPVVAMTANAFGEDRHACLNAGMNDHLAKPADADALFAMLLRWLPLPDAAHAEPVEASWDDNATADGLAAAVPGMDVARALGHCAGRPATLIRLLQRFGQLYAQGVPALRDGATAPGTLWLETAHSLRGACAALGLGELTDRLEAFERALDQGQEPSALAAEAADIDAGVRRVAAAALQVGGGPFRSQPGRSRT